MITGNNLGKGMINDPSTIYPAIIKVRRALGLIREATEPH
jgi:hypothetical protein